MFDPPAETLLRFEGAEATLFTTPKAWNELLELAETAGWAPEHPPACYRADIGLRVSRQDASNLAQALRRARSRLTSSYQPAGRTVGGVLRNLVFAGLLVELNELSAFCREGGFEIR